MKIKEKEEVSGILLLLDNALDESSQFVRESFAEGMTELLDRYGLIKKKTTLDQLMEIVNPKILDDFVAESENVAESKKPDPLSWVTVRSAARTTGFCTKTVINKIKDKTVTGEKRNHKWYILESDLSKITNNKPNKRKRKKTTSASPEESSRRKDAILSILSDGREHTVIDVCNEVIERCDFSMNPNKIATASKVIAVMQKKGLIDWKDMGPYTVAPGRHDLIFLPAEKKPLTNDNKSWANLFSMN